MKANCGSATGEPLIVDPEVVKVLLEYGAEVDAKNRGDSTPLRSAMKHCNADVVKLLLDHGADTGAVDEA